MNAQGILTRIENDARDAAAQQLREAQRRGEALQNASNARIEKQRDAALDAARRDALSLDDRMQRMARLDARKEMLAVKREVLNEAFARALDKMMAMPPQQARAFGLSMLLEAATGKETVIADAASAWCDQSFVAEANEALRKAGKPGAITLSGETRDLGGGFVMERGGMEINCSWRAALEGKRMDIEAEVAALLFEED